MPPPTPPIFSRSPPTPLPLPPSLVQVATALSSSSTGRGQGGRRKRKALVLDVEGCEVKDDMPFAKAKVDVTAAWLEHMKAIATSPARIPEGTTLRVGSICTGSGMCGIALRQLQKHGIVQGDVEYVFQCEANATKRHFLQETQHSRFVFSDACKLVAGDWEARSASTMIAPPVDLLVTGTECKGFSGLTSRPCSMYPACMQESVTHTLLLVLFYNLNSPISTESLDSRYSDEGAGPALRYDENTASGSTVQAVLAYCAQKKPAMVLWENVARMGHGRKAEQYERTADLLVQEMQKLGYSGGYTLCNSNEFFYHRAVLASIIFSSSRAMAHLTKPLRKCGTSPSHRAPWKICWHQPRLRSCRCLLTRRRGGPATSGKHTWRSTWLGMARA